MKKKLTRTVNGGWAVGPASHFAAAIFVAALAIFTLNACERSAPISTLAPLDASPQPTVPVATQPVPAASPAVPAPTVPVTVAVTAPAPVATQPAPSGPAFPYTVRSGDTLAIIATRFNTTVATLRALNGLTGDLIIVGQQLIIPGTAPAPAAPSPTPRQTVYIVRVGDTLYRISLRFGVSVTAIARANGITDPNHIEPGQRLIIPLP